MKWHDKNRDKDDGEFFFVNIPLDYSNDEHNQKILDEKIETLLKYLSGLKREFGKVNIK